jgi:PilZ domain
MRSRSKSKAINSDHLPELNAFVDVAMGGKTESVPVESIGRTELAVRGPSNAAVGTTALFNYVNGRGSFRFHAQCTAVEGRTATFALPPEITVLQKVRDQRRSLRLNYALPVVWRYAPDGVGYGEFSKGATVDISTAGVALMVPRELRMGTLVEIKFDLGDSGVFAVIGALARQTVRQPSGKFLAGIDLRVNPLQANAIDDFIATRQRGQRKRGIADRHT